MKHDLLCLLGSYFMYMRVKKWEGKGRGKEVKGKGKKAREKRKGRKRGKGLILCSYPSGSFQSPTTDQSLLIRIQYMMLNQCSFDSTRCILSYRLLTPFWSFLDLNLLASFGPRDSIWSSVLTWFDVLTCFDILYVF